MNECWKSAASPMMVLKLHISLAEISKKTSREHEKQDPGYPGGKVLYM